MIIYEDRCCDCAAPGYPCLGSSCPNRNMPILVCDECEEEAELYWFDDKQLCADCILAHFKRVE